MTRTIWLFALAGCANLNTGSWEGETFDCVDPAHDGRELTFDVVYEAMNGSSSRDLELAPEIEALAAGCTNRPMGLGFPPDDPVAAAKQWKCDDGMFQINLDSTGEGDQRLATLETTGWGKGNTRGTEYLCMADLYRQ